MAEKTMTGEKKDTKAVAAKAAAPAKKAVAKTSSGKRLNKGDSLVCETCGLTVVVDDCGDVVAVQEILCCEQPMKPKTSRSKAPASKK
jgi:hypothetical protein